eukprot:g14009.t1
MVSAPTSGVHYVDPTASDPKRMLAFSGSSARQDTSIGPPPSLDRSEARHLEVMSATAFLRELRGAGDRKAFAKEHVDTLAFFLQRPIAEFVPRHPNTLPKRRDLDHALLQSELRLPSEDDVYHVFHCYQAHKLLKRYQTTVASAAECGADSVAAVDLYDAAVQTKIPTTEVVQELRFFLHAERVAVFRVFAVLMRCKEPGCLSEAMIRKLVNNAHASYLAMNQLDPDCCEMLQTALETQIACLETLVAVADAKVSRQATTSSGEIADPYAVYGFPTLADLCRQFSAESFLGCLHFLRPKITGTFFKTHPDAGAVLRANQALYFRLAQHVADLGVVVLLLLMQRTVRDGPENPKIAPDEVAQVHSEIGSWASEFADRVPHNPAVNNEDFGFLFPPSSGDRTLSQNEQSEEEESRVKAFEQQHVLKQTAVLSMQWLVVASDRERSLERGEKQRLNLGKALGRSRAAQVSPRLLPFALQEIVGRGRIFGGGSWGQSCAASSSVLSPFDGKVPVARVLAHLGFEDDELSGGSTCREGFFRSHFCAHKTVFVDFCSSVSECVELRDCAMLLPNALSFVVANAFAAPGGPQQKSTTASRPSTPSLLQRRKQEIWSVDIQERKGLQPLLAHMVNDLGTYLPSLLNILANILTNDADNQVYDTLMQLLLRTRVNSFTTLLPSVADCVSMSPHECGTLQQDVYLEHFFLRQFGVGCSPVYDPCCARFAAGGVGRLVRKAVVVGGNGQIDAAVGVHWVVGEGGGFAILPLVLLAVDGFLDCHAHAVLRATGSNLPAGTGIGEIREAPGGTGLTFGGNSAAGGLSAPLETALPAAAITFLCKLVAAFPEKFRDAEPELPLSADGLREARKRSAMRGGMSDATMMMALCSFGGVGRDENLADDKIQVPLIPRLFKLFLCCAGHAKYRFLVPTVLEALAAYFKAGGPDDDELPEANSYDELLATSENEDEKIIKAERQQKQGHEKLPPGGTTANGGSSYGEADNLYNRRHPRDLAAGAGSRPFRAAAAQVPSGPSRSNGASPHQRPQPDGPVQHRLKKASNDRARAFSLLLLVEEYQTAFFACLHAILEAEKAEGGCYSNLLSVLDFFQAVLDAVPAASWGRNWHKLAQTGHLSADGNGNKTSGSDGQPAIESLAQIRESQFGLLEDWLQFVFASVFAKHQSGWAYARSTRSVSQQIGAACVRIARLAFTSLFGSCRSLLALADQTSPDQTTGSNEGEQRFDIRSNSALGTRRDAETMRDLTANLRKRQYRLMQLFSENAVILQILTTVTCEMVVFQQAEETGSTETGNNSAVMSSAVSSTTPKSSKVLGFLNRSSQTESGRLRGCGFGAGRSGSRIARGNRGEKEGEQVSGEGESLVERTEDHDLLQRLLLGATWAPNQVPGAADPFRVVDYAHFYERDADEALLLEALELLNAVLVACCTDGCSGGSSPLTQLRDHLLAQTSTPTCARQQSLCLLQTGTPAARAVGGSKSSEANGATASAEIFSLDLVKSLFHLATRSRATDDHQSVAVSVLAAQALKQQCLLWEVPETRIILGKDLYLSEFLSVNCAPVAVSTSGPSPNQADRLALAVVKPPAEKEDPKNAKDENRENTMKSTSKSSSTRRHHDVHLGHLFVSRLLRVREPDLREALLALACVGVRFQSSVFLALDRQPLIQRCLQLVQECAQAFPGDDESHKVKGDKENNNKTVSRPLRRWIARYSSLLWHGVHLLGEVVNTLFVDFADLTQVWLLLVAVHEKLALAVREIVPDFFLPENYSTKNGRGGKATATAAASRQYYFYLVNSVKEIYFLAYVGIAKQANCLEAMSDRTDFSSGSFGSLRLLLATCLTDEYELWLQDETTTDFSMFVPPKTLEATRERLRARCHKAGIREDLYVELMAAGTRNAVGRSSSSADAGSSGSTPTKHFSGEEQTTEANTVLIHAHAEENYQRLMRQEVADDLIRSVGAGAAQIAGATNPTSYQPDAVTDALNLNPHGQRVVQSARYGYLANRSGNVASVAAAPSLRAARTLSDVSVVRAEAMRASSMIFDRLERARCLKKHFLSSGGSTTTSTLPNLADALELLANYTDSTGRQHRFEDGSAFEELSQVVTLQHECVGMLSQLVLATAELSAHVANKFRQTTLANDLISPILPRLIPYLSQVLADQFGITGVIGGGTSTPLGGLTRSATSMVPCIAMLVTVVNRLLQFPLYFSPGMQFPVFGKWFSGVNTNNPPRLPDAMLAVLGITNEPTKQGAQLSLQLAGFLSWSVRKIVAGARDDIDGGQRYSWGRDLDARPQQLLDGIVAVAGLLSQLLPALVGVEGLGDDEENSSNTSGEREEPSRAEVEEIGVAVLRAVTELLHFHQQHGPPALGVFGSAPVSAFSEDPKSSYQSWFYREAAASRKTGTAPEVGAPEISACFLNAGFGALLLSLVERVANILPVEEYTDAYSSFLSVLTQASRNGMWRLQPGARSSEVARLLGGGGNNLNSTSHDTSNIKSQFLYGSTGATTVGSVTQKSLQQVTAARIDACVSLFATLGGGSITGATLLLEYGILEHAASNVGLQAFYGNGVVETSAYADEARKPLHCSWTQLLALVAQLLATAGPSSSFDQFLNGYEERFLYLLEERDMITELAMLEEVVMMSKILAHLPAHDARTTYLLCMALQTQHFLASVLLSENEVTSSDVIRPLTVTERIAGRAGQIHTFLPAEVPSIFHQRAQYLCYEMSRHLLSALLKLIGQEPGLLSQEYFEVDYAGAATAAATPALGTQLAIGYQLGDGGQFGQRTLADGVLFQPGHQRGAPPKESVYFGGLAGTQPYVAERRMYAKRVHWSVLFEQLVDSARRASHFLGSLEEVLGTLAAGTLAGGGENANPPHPEMHNLARPRIPAALLLADRARSNRESEDAFLNRGGSKFGMDKRPNFGGPPDSWGAEEVMPTSGSAVQMPALEPDVLTDFLDEVEEVARRKREAALSPVVIDMEEVIDGPQAQARATGEPSYQGDNKKTRGNIAGPRKRFRPTGLAESKKSLSAAQRLLLSAAGGSAASTGELEGKMKRPVPKLTTSNLGELGAPGPGVERERPGGESSVCVPLALYLVRNPYAEDGAEVSSGTGGGGARHSSMSRPSVGALMSPRIEVTRKDHSRVGGMCALPVGTQPLGVVPEAVTVAEYHSLCLTCLELAITCVYQYCCAPGLNNENVLYAILNLLHQMTQDPGFLSAHESTKELLLLIEDSLRQRSVLRDL